MYTCDTFSLKYISTCIICNIQPHNHQFSPCICSIIVPMYLNYDLRALYLYIYADIMVLKCIRIHAYLSQLLLITTPDEPHSSTRQLDDLCWGIRCV